MTLAYPWIFWAGLALSLIAAWWARRLESGKRPAVVYSAVGGRPRQRPSLKAVLALWLPLAAKIAALVLLAFALARPQSVKSRVQSLGQGIDIMLVVDTSLSMGALDFNPGSRLDAAKETARRFISGRVQDRIGLVQFGGAAILGCPLTSDYEALAGRLGELEPGMTKADGTAIGDGIVSGINHLRSSAAKSKVLILLTDGRSNTGLIDPITAAKTAAAMGIRIYAVGAATKGESLMPVDDPQQGRVLVRIADDLDEDLLSEVAAAADGKYFRATSIKELHGVYAEIDALEKSGIKLPDVVSRRDRYPFFLIAALFLLLAESSLSATWLVRWP